MNDIYRLLKNQSEEVQKYLSQYEARTMTWSLDRIVKLCTEYTYLTLVKDNKVIRDSMAIRPVLSDVMALKELSDVPNLEELVFKELSKKELFYRNEVLSRYSTQRVNGGMAHLNVGLLMIRLNEIKVEVEKQVSERKILSRNLKRWRTCMISAFSSDRIIELRI